MTRGRADDLTGAVAEFAGLEEFMDTPHPFNVAEDPTALKNTRTVVNQLTVLEVEWD